MTCQKEKDCRGVGGRSLIKRRRRREEMNRGRREEKARSRS
jgi:hypothetical protein